MNKERISSKFLVFKSLNWKIWYICHSLVMYSFNGLHQNTKIIEIDEESDEKTLKNQ